MFDRVYLINLKRRQDRLVTFENLRMQKGWELPEPIVFEAIDGNKVGVPDYYVSGGGAWGCCRSHVRILEMAIMDGISSVLVLEDDLTWTSDTWQRLKEFLSIVPSDWDQLMLGGQHLRDPERISPGVVQCKNTQRTHAYAIRGRAMKDLLRQWYRCNTHIDHVMGAWHEKWRVYAPECFLFGQGAGQSDISGNRDHIRFWVPPSQSAIVVHLTAPREVANKLRENYGFHMGYTRNRETDLDAGLVALAASPSPERGFKKWLDTILWEATSEENAVATVWHPDFTADMVKAIYEGTVVEIVGNSLEECLAQIPKQEKRKGALCDTHIVLLRSPRGIMESLRGHGWHSGYWKDELTGQDNGLRAVASLSGGDRLVKLKEWIVTLTKEAESVRGGMVCVWHPEITSTELGDATALKVIEVVAESIGEALQKFQENL